MLPRLEQHTREEPIGSIARLIPLEASSDVVSSSSTNDANTQAHHQMVPMEIQLEIPVDNDDKQQRKVKTK